MKFALYIAKQILYSGAVSHGVANIICVTGKMHAGA